MTPLTAFLAKFLGAYMLVAAMWLVLRKDVALELVERIARDPVGVATIGMIRVTVGLAIVLGHDIWTGGVAIFVSALGWIIFLNGLLTLFLPQNSVAALVGRMRYKDSYPAFALVSFVLGGTLLIGGFTG
ncbi:MAG: hypothetical protein N2444_04110 [Methylocystis sp.]|nr:hypothetical protein [Methylocystis sp.]